METIPMEPFDLSNVEGNPLTYVASIMYSIGTPEEEIELFLDMAEGQDCHTQILLCMDALDEINEELGLYEEYNFEPI